MKIFAVFVVVSIALIGFGLFPNGSAVPPSEGTANREAIFSTIDRRIGNLLSPLPLQQSGILSYATAEQEISGIRQDVQQLIGSTIANPALAKQSADNLCNLLSIIASERNSYLRRVNNTRIGAPISRLVDTGPPDSSWVIDRLRKRRENEEARAAELAGRVKWFETNISLQWDGRRGQLRQQTDAHFALLRTAAR